MIDTNLFCRALHNVRHKYNDTIDNPITYTILAQTIQKYNTYLLREQVKEHDYMEQIGTELTDPNQ